MTRKEFEERTGLQVTEAEFRIVNDFYMSAGVMDKDTFCRREHDKGMEKKEECERLYAERWEIVDFLLERAQKFGDIELLKKAIDMVGHSDVIRRKLSLEMPLWALDRAYIRKNLK